jgi:ATP-dependent Clp protease ATP-binding subunit ClpA
MQPTCRQHKFTELSASNFKIMCRALELRAPQHQDIIPDITTTVLLCRSGLSRKARSFTSSTTWLLFQGNDFYGKKAMAQELAKVVFGAYTEFSLVNSVERCKDTTLKRKRSENSDKLHVTRTLIEAIQHNPHRVMFLDGINQLDCESETAIKNLIATGRIMGFNGKEMVTLEDTIFVLSSDEAFSSRTSPFPLVYNRNSNTQNHMEDATVEKGVGSRPFTLDLNACGKDVEDKEHDNVINNVGIIGVVDGVYRLD